jgi:YesN/AraC family two-component response regulator
MTGDEMERAIEFLLQGQAKFEVQFEKTQQQMERTQQQLELMQQQLKLTDQRVSIFAETQSEFMQTMLQHVHAQGEINASLRRKTDDLAQVIEGGVSGLAQVIEQRFFGLAQVTEQRISELALAQGQTQKDISDLAKTVGDLVKAIHRNGNPPQG